MDKALLLLQIQKRALEAASVKEVGFHIVNSTKKLIDYRRAIFWTKNGRHIKLQSVSGNNVLDQHGPHSQWLQKKIRDVCQKIGSQESHFLFDPSGLSKGEVKGWLDHSAPHVCLLTFRFGEEDTIIGGVWLEREKAFKEAEIEILKELGFTYSRALVLGRLSGKRQFLPMSEKARPYSRYIWLMLLLIALFPVRLSITAPAEVISTSSKVLSVPFDGLISDIRVSPGEVVEEGQILADMNIEELQLSADTARQDLKAAESKLSRLQREVLANPDKKTELNRLLSEIRTKEIEAEYADLKLETALLKSPNDGIAIFADKNDLQGKPVQAGQAIMQVADADDVELLVRVSVPDMMPLNQDMAATFYPHATPLQSYSAQIKTIGYQASEDPDGLLSYKVRAALPENMDEIRIGWKGVVKIKGDWSVLIYKILRRPLMTIRSTLGV